jgi:hypothetical protein
VWWRSFQTTPGPSQCGKLCLDLIDASGGAVIDDVTATVRVGAVPPVLQWQYWRLVHYLFTIPKYLSTYGCSPNEFLGPASLGSEDESDGLPNDVVMARGTRRRPPGLSQVRPSPPKPQSKMRGKRTGPRAPGRTLA